MLKKEMLYDLDDVTIIPSYQSSVRHRDEVYPYHNVNGTDYLPIFVSPMECVISKDNFHEYDRNGVIPIMPRTETLQDRIFKTRQNYWSAYGLEEFVDVFCTEDNNLIWNLDKQSGEWGNSNTFYALIDNANGHMDELPVRIRQAKKIAIGKGYCLKIMAGNIANPDTYKVLADAGADYVRCSVGNGNCCLTASNTSTYMPMASLLDVCRYLKVINNLKCAIVADGGINSYNRAIKALALGADYVMIGSVFGKCFESSSKFINADFSGRDLIDGFGLDDLNGMRFDGTITEEQKKKLIGIYKPVKALWGMSTRRAQVSIGLACGKKKKDIKLKTSEGVEKHANVEYTLHQWLENFTDYLRSSMSYCNAFSLDDYIGQPSIRLMSEAARNAINK